MSTRSHDEGGDPACWLDRVCEECGRIREDPAAACPHCAAAQDPAVRAGGAPAPETSRRRDRDAEGRARNARPRDGLGRPLPYGSPGVARQPEGVVREPTESLAEAQRLLDDGMPFHAHEVLEDAWKSGPPAERELWRGLAQLAVGLTHAARGNVTGAGSLLTRGAAAIGPYAGTAPHGVDVDGLIRWAGELVGSLRGPVPAADHAPRLRVAAER
ncbi:hypothetical protein GCM10010361_24090 [Streptomyces olivaceiscleroticus]|uniref:DUF309 domain-containing protein n=1 Tax=Streptomyces olivaceiscleroticus TaxID=68245 RepID=A0ABN0ZUF4_9ACTN